MARPPGASAQATRPWIGTAPQWPSSKTPSKGTVLARSPVIARSLRSEGGGLAAPRARRRGRSPAGRRGPGSIQQGESPVQFANLLPRAGMTRLDLAHRLELAAGGGGRLGEDVHPCQVAVGKVARLIARGSHRPREPRDRLFGPPQLDEIGADVVVGVAEGGVDLDRRVTMGNGLVEPALRALRPPEKRVRLGGGLRLDRFLVEADGLVDAPIHLGPVREFEVPPRLGGGVL